MLLRPAHEGRPFLRRWLRLALCLALAVPIYVGDLGWQVDAAWADDDDFDDDDDDDDDDDFGDEDEYEDDDEEEEEDDYQQPPYYAGGLYTKKTWPQAELQRNLTLIKGMLEVRAGIDADVSNQTAFEIWRSVVDGRYGVSDTFELQAGFLAVLAGDIGGLDNNAEFYLGFENAILFDVVNFRLLAELEYQDVDEDAAAFNFVIGLPMRFRIKDKVGVFALDRLLTVRTDGEKPDLTVGIGVLFQPLPIVAGILRGEVQVARANFDQGISVPATAAVQLSPNNQVDLGLEFSFSNLNQEADMVEWYDNRRLLLYGQFRI